MSQARVSVMPNERGQYRSWCDRCESEGYFPTLVMAIAATKEHLCDGEVPSCSWPGWAYE